MTAIPRRRRRRTVVGAVSAVLLVVAAGAMFVIGVITLSNSQEGEAVGVDERPRVRFPATPNAVLAVTDERGRLASLVVTTLLPEGQGGSIVTMPVDSTLPLSANFVTTSGLMSTHTSRTPAGVMLPVPIACSIEQSIMIISAFSIALAYSACAS